MNQDLTNLLNKLSCSDTVNVTHVSYYGPNNKYNISGANLKNFWIEYCKLVDNNSEDLCMGEIPGQYVPLIVDFTFKFHKDSTDTYEEKFIISLVYCIQQAILETITTSNTGEELACVFLFSDEVIDTQYITSRYRFQFPKCKTLSSVQNRFIRPVIIDTIRRENILSYLKEQPIGDWENIISQCNGVDPYSMYGSVTNPNEAVLNLGEIYDYVQQEHIENCSPKTYDINEFFDFAKHEHIIKNLIPMSIFTDDKNYWLPFFLSLSYWPKISHLQVTIEDSSITNSLSTQKFSNSTNISYSIEQETEEQKAERFITMLKRDRAEKISSWLDVGRVLSKIFKGSKQGLQLWINFTNISDEFDEEDCRKYYNSFAKNYLTIKTLAWYAKVDSPAEYEKWHKLWYMSALEKALTLTHTDVSNAVYRVFWLEFSALDDGTIYHYKNHIWKKTTKGLELKRKITNEFIGICERVRIDLSTQIHLSKDYDFKERNEESLEKYNKLIRKLKDHNFKLKIVAEIVESFHNPDYDLASILDSNINLIGMKNGIIEINKSEVEFRCGKPEDFISKTTGIDYVDYNNEDVMVIKVKDWFREVFPDEELLDYSWKIFSSFLKGGNDKKKIYIMSGAGHNSKSMIKSLLECSFGSYCVDLPTTVFTTKKQSSAPAPEIARSKGAHIAILAEPESTEPMRSGDIKVFTGGDRIFTRALNDNGGEIEILFTLILMCNNIPIVPQSDKALKERWEIIPFLSTWSYDAPDSREEQFKTRTFKRIDSFKETIPDMASAFIWCLIQYYSKYINEGLKQPKIVREHIDEYWKDNDIYMQFISENITVAHKIDPNIDSTSQQPIDENSKIKVSEIYSKFREWFRDNYPGLQTFDKPVFIAEISQRLKQRPKNNFWYGYKYKIEVNFNI